MSKKGEVTLTLTGDGYLQIQNTTEDDVRVFFYDKPEISSTSKSLSLLIYSDSTRKYNDRVFDRVYLREGDHGEDIIERSTRTMVSSPNVRIEKRRTQSTAWADEHSDEEDIPRGNYASKVSGSSVQHNFCDLEVTLLKLQTYCARNGYSIQFKIAKENKVIYQNVVETRK